MRTANRLIGPLALVLALAGGCDFRVARERAEADLEVGLGATGGVEFSAAGGLAHLRSLAPGQLELWASAPRFEIEAECAADATERWTITALNLMPGATLGASTASGPLEVIELERPRATAATWQVDLPPGESVTLVVTPADAEAVERWRFAVLGDIQEALPEVDDIFRVIAADPSLRFVVSTGDLVDRGGIDEYDLLDRQRAGLPIPFFSTIGNHELYGDPAEWRDRYGRFSSHFEFKGTVFSLADSADATIDPLVYDWLDDWLADGAERVHVFLTHIPPIDPVGVRSGSFRSRAEAAKLLERLAAGGVDLTLYGHIHSLYRFENAGIPAYISGGGGAWPERWDDIGRHFLAVEVDPDRVVSVTAVPID